MHNIGAKFVPFTAQTRMSGVNLDGREIRKGAADAVENYVNRQGGHFPADVAHDRRGDRQAGGTPLVVAEAQGARGHRLKDIVKGGIKERFAEMRRMGIKTS